MSQNLPEVRGINVDSQTRCAHYCKPVDIIAIKMKCCGVYYACKDCHIALADHEIVVWLRREWDQKAILCGVCGAELTINRYMSSGYRCPRCNAEFNPACRNHYHYYFEAEA
ncbi:MAG: CHY zinc finger protein [Candidatus Sulfotelmatobacter sp.]